MSDGKKISAAKNNAEIKRNRLRQNAVRKNGEMRLGESIKTVAIQRVPSPTFFRLAPHPFDNPARQAHIARVMGLPNTSPTYAEAVCKLRFGLPSGVRKRVRSPSVP